MFVVFRGGEKKKEKTSSFVKISVSCQSRENMVLVWLAKVLHMPTLVRDDVIGPPDHPSSSGFSLCLPGGPR